MHGVSIRCIKRAGIDIPVFAQTTIDCGDTLELVGLKKEDVYKRQNNRGKEVANAPMINNIGPTSFSPCTKLGPAEMPTTAMNIFKMCIRDSR